MVDKYLEIYQNLGDVSCAAFCKDINENCLDPKVVSNMDEIISSARTMVADGVKIVFDPTLVRGMGYYTGPIFEVTIDDYNFSIAGGGRYDKMIGKFTGMETPACGFSIGFERIVTILMEQGGEIENAAPKKAYLIEKGMDPARYGQIMKQAMGERKAGVQVLVSMMNKNKKFQKEQLNKEGYNEFVEFYKEALK